MGLVRPYLVELVGTFAFVYLAAGLTCVNVMTTPADATPGTTAMTTQQPGLVGVALGQALIWIALTAWSAPVSGGYLNPAVAIARWVFNRLSTVRFAWFLGAQILGSVAAAFAVRWTFDPAILRAAHGGLPCLNPLAFSLGSSGALWTGTSIELLLTFFFVLAMFATVERTPAPWLSGAVLAVAVLFAGPLTGAALNPARWFGPVFWQMAEGAGDKFAAQQGIVYVGGPLIGALLAGAFAFGVYLPARNEADQKM